MNRQKNGKLINKGVAELIQKLQQLDPNKEVYITDGYEGIFYKGDFTVGLFDDGDDSFVDIGIGGFNFVE